MIDSRLCPACRIREASELHHCHLEDLISTHLEIAARDAGLSKWRHGHWRRDERVRNVLRFAPTNVCPACNAIDGLTCWQPHRPSRYFSFSPVELREIRVLAKTDGNRGARIRLAVLAVGNRALPEFHNSIRRANLVANLIAREWRAGDNLVDRGGIDCT